MKGGARRRTITSNPPPSPPHSTQLDIDSHETDDEQQPMHEEDEDYEPNDVEIAAPEVTEERPKLAEGFYEIEGVRKKRIRKGESQYLIKWRGWPETSNTWEPVENLMSCSDVIDAFEESLRSGTQRSYRKRKRKSAVTPAPQSKKKQKHQPQQSSPADTYSVPSVKVKIIEESSSLPSVHNSNFGNGTSSNEKTRRQANDNESLLSSPQIGEKKERNESGVKLNEPKDTSFINQESMNEFAIHIQEDQAPQGVRPANGILKIDGTEPIRASSRTGAKRRKSGAVKRFKQDSNPVFTNDATEKTTSASDVVGQRENQITGLLGNGLDPINTVDSSRGTHAITKIIKPVHYSASALSGSEEVCVTFSVMRSDGQVTTVDNKYLKATHPLLLISFYEQHLRYNE